ncbi:MAG: signal peptidase I [Ruminococcus sp.]|nr:signal peptidase I [Ruminococcus sp.]
MDSNNINNKNNDSNATNDTSVNAEQKVDTHSHSTDTFEGLEDEDKPQKNIIDEFCDMVESVLFSIFTVILIFTFLFKVASVVGTSMVPTLQNDDKLIVSSAFYSNPKNQDIVIIDCENAHLLEDSDGDGNVDDVYETAGLNKTIVKRIIAVEGQTLDIDFENGNVYVDGEIINEPYINNLTLQDHGSFEYPITIPEGYVFVMGDNRGVSKDSRSDEVGLIPVDDIIGKVILRISPLENFGLLD